MPIVFPHQIHCQLSAAIVEYADGRPPWAVPPLAVSYPQLAIGTDESKAVIINSGGEIQLVDVDAQIILSTISSAKLGQGPQRVVLSGAQVFYMASRGLVRVRVAPFEAELLDQWSEVEAGLRYRLSPRGSAPYGTFPDEVKIAGLDLHGRIVMFPSLWSSEPGKRAESSVLLLDPLKLDAQRIRLDTHLDMPKDGVTSPCGRWLVRLRYSAVEYVAAGKRLPAATAPLHPDLAGDERERWGFLLELWDLDTWRLHSLIPARYLTEPELPLGWLLEHSAGEGDPIWHFSGWFGIAGEKTPELLQKYAKRRQDLDKRRVAARDRLTYMASVGATCLNDLELQDRQEKRSVSHAHTFGTEHFRGLVEMFAWESNGDAFWTLFSDGAIRRIGVDGQGGPLAWFERFQHESWRDIGPQQKRSTATRARYIDVSDNGAIRVSDSSHRFGFTRWLNIDNKMTWISTSDDGYLPERFRQLNAEASSAKQRMVEHHVVLTDLTEASCIAAIRTLTEDIDRKHKFEKLVFDGEFNPRFQLPDRLLGESEFFDHVRDHCPNAVMPLRILIGTLLQDWTKIGGDLRRTLYANEFDTSLASAVAALAALDPDSLPLVRAYCSDIDYDHQQYFRSKFFEIVAPTGRWRDPRWLEVGVHHLVHGDAESHWRNLGFRDAAMVLSDTSTFLSLFCRVFDKERRSFAERQAMDALMLVAHMRERRERMIARGERLTWSERDENYPAFDAEADIADYIDGALENFIRRHLTDDAFDFKLKSELIALRPSLEARLAVAL